MADLKPEDIKDPDDEGEPAVPPDPNLPPEDEPKEGEDEDEKEESVLDHLVAAVTELARYSGSPPAVMAALQRIQAKKET